MSNTPHLINWISNSFGHIGFVVTADRTIRSCHIEGKRGSWDARVMLSAETTIKAHLTNLDEAKAWCAEIINEAIDTLVAA